MRALVDAVRAGEGRPLGEHTTHIAHELDGVCVKVFVDAVRDEAAREWEALWVAHHHAPEVVPRPLWHCEDAVVMTMVPGEPVTASDLETDAFVALHRSLAAIDPTPLRTAILTAAGARDRVLQRRMLVTSPPEDGAWDASSRWLGSVEAREIAGWPLDSFGRGDPNPRNLLRDGDVLRAVDFEDAGRTNAIMQAADHVEHLEMHDAPSEVVDAIIEDFDAAQILAARRLIAIAWYGHLLTNPKAQRLNPPERLRQQAERVLSLL